MPKVACRCRYVFDLSPDAPPYVHALLAFSVIFQLLAKADERALEVGEMEHALLEKRQEVLLCPNCGRLLIESRAKPGFYDSYTPELPFDVNGEATLYAEPAPRPTNGSARGTEDKQ